MSFNYSPESFSVCPFCRKQSCTVTESRINKDNTRRRRKTCKNCSKRHTVYEVSEEFYKKAVEHDRLIQQFIKSLNLGSDSPTLNALEHTTCDYCVHMRSSGCYFDFPDAGGTFASECSMFERSAS